MSDRIISGDPQPSETHDKALRPQTLAEFVGQRQHSAQQSDFHDATVLLFEDRGYGMPPRGAIRNAPGQRRPAKMSRCPLTLPGSAGMVCAISRFTHPW